jgi:hypothetical protein
MSNDKKSNLFYFLITQATLPIIGLSSQRTDCMYFSTGSLIKGCAISLAYNL